MSRSRWRPPPGRSGSSTPSGRPLVEQEGVALLLVGIADRALDVAVDGDLVLESAALSLGGHAELDNQVLRPEASIRASASIDWIPSSVSTSDTADGAVIVEE